MSSRWTSVEAGAESERDGAGLLLCRTRRVLYGFVGHIINQYRFIDLLDSLNLPTGERELQTCGPPADGRAACAEKLAVFHAMRAAMSGAALKEGRASPPAQPG